MVGLCGSYSKGVGPFLSVLPPRCVGLGKAFPVLCREVPATPPSTSFFIAFECGVFESAKDDRTVKTVANHSGSLQLSREYLLVLLGNPL
ncbi:hypothetical protein TSH58p_24895 (plasmid) [Azospirillum sp. TSH58]|nr:hypothetical protein TSH58p_24895 [Azospirillum sp. TSH58]